MTVGTAHCFSAVSAISAVNSDVRPLIRKGSANIEVPYFPVDFPYAFSAVAMVVPAIPRGENGYPSTRSIASRVTGRITPRSVMMPAM